MTLFAGLQYGIRAGLFDESTSPEVAPLMRGRIVIAQSLYAIATATCIVFPTWVSIALIFLVQLNYVIAPRIPIHHRFLTPITARRWRRDRPGSQQHENDRRARPE